MADVPESWIARAELIRKCHRKRMPVELIARQLRIPQWLVREVVHPEQAPAVETAQSADVLPDSEPAADHTDPEPEPTPQPAPATKPEPQQPARKRTSFNSYPQQRRRPAAPAQRQAEQEQIERHLQEKGVTKCPPAYAAPIGNLDRSGEGFW